MVVGGCADSEFRQTTGAKEPVKVPELEKELAEVLVEEAKGLPPRASLSLTLTPLAMVMSLEDNSS